MKALLILAAIAALTTLGILITGVVGMARGGEFNRKWGNKLMQMRVASQAITLVLLFLLALAAAA
ncbi:HIG1 domain-containing protein [Yunchengibacter salinarum]|uniref:HIG1 domain-containing protein n=1 Tax=Yunchengibacter salinarum TaxID=3133399 RepID=UPI0035B60640